MNSETIKKKKICFFSGDITRSGGTERVSLQVARHLWKTEGFKVMFLSIVEQQEHPFFPIPDSIERHTLSPRKTWISPGAGYLPLVPKLRRFLKEQKPDVIIDIDTILDILTVPAAKGLGTKVLAWEHFNYDYAWPSPLYRMFRKGISRFTSRYADYIVTLTERDTKNYRTRLGRKDRICTIYNPIELPSPKERLPRREQILITVGRLTHVKGIDMLAELAPKVLSRHEDWTWYVLGEGEDRGILEEVCRKHHLKNRLVLTGNVTDVPSWLRKSALYVMTSRAEGLPMCLLEAVGCGLPAVSFDIPTGPGEIIENGTTGFLIPPFDLEEMEEKIELLIENKTLREAFSKNTGEVQDKFAPACIFRQWEILLQQLSALSDE